MLKDFNYPKLAKEKFETALNDRLSMRERYDALKVRQTLR